MELEFYKKREIVESIIKVPVDRSGISFEEFNISLSQLHSAVYANKAKYGEDSKFKVYLRESDRNNWDNYLEVYMYRQETDEELELRKQESLHAFEMTLKERGIF